MGSGVVTAGLGYKRKQNQNKSFEKQKVQKKTNFVHGKSSEEEKELQFRRQSNEEFHAQKKKQQQAKDVSKKTCFKCDQIGHVARKCPNTKPVDVEKQKSEDVRRKFTRFDSKQTWKYNTNKFASNQTWKPKQTRSDSRQTKNSHTPRFRTTQSWQTSVDMTKPNQFWKPKIVVQSKNNQNESRFL
ncbi:putative transcription factor interactor and regulator CCHC(Zn) family [Helianthus annuus]|nr:putative transcription factor interactor and regulator CCHC(Zn) family [Helianthus annuus]KAJ0647904.1 putative transcription factor interactor and regulator CCHC(Zn) family [Helianthus annuus]KAJ0651760.1 putative transcription factor interactor and regulator CCHC(Zn) family [Helianthus annuus]